MYVESKLVARRSESRVKVSSAGGIKFVGRWKIIRKKRLMLVQIVGVRQGKFMQWITMLLRFCVFLETSMCIFVFLCLSFLLSTFFF